MTDTDTEMVSIEISKQLKEAMDVALLEGDTYDSLIRDIIDEFIDCDGIGEYEIEND